MPLNGKELCLVPHRLSIAPFQNSLTPPPLPIALDMYWNTFAHFKLILFVSTPLPPTPPLSLEKSSKGPMVKHISKTSLQTQLREGDVIMEMNDEPMQKCSHNELESLLKSCPKGNEITFIVMRTVDKVRAKRCTCIFSCACAHLSWTSSNPNEDPIAHFKRR